MPWQGERRQGARHTEPLVSQGASTFLLHQTVVCQVCHSVVSEMPQLKKVSLLKMLTTV